MKSSLGFVILVSKLFPVVLVMLIPASYESGAQVAANKTVKCDSVYINQKYKYHRNTFCVNGCKFLSLIPKWFDCRTCRIIKCFE